MLVYWKMSSMTHVADRSRENIFGDNGEIILGIDVVFDPFPGRYI
jgi:hypothetical protein